MININTAEYSNNYQRRGIYKDLYKAIEGQKHPEPDSFKAKLPRGIYKDIYESISKEKDDISKAAQAVGGSVVKRGIYRDIYASISRQKEEAVKAASKKKDEITALVNPKNSDGESIWHTYPLKLLVYSNDFGNAIRPVIGSLGAKLSWIPAILYTVLSVNSNKEKKDKTKELIFQGIASFLMPTMAAKASRKAMIAAIDNMPSKFKNSIKTQISKSDMLKKTVDKFKRNGSSGYRNLALTLSGLATLGIIAKPIDKVVKKYLEPYFAAET